MNTKILTLTSIVSLALVGCGGGSSSDEPTPEPLTNDTGELKDNAIGAIGRRFDGGLTAVGSTLNQNTSVGNTINDVATGGSDQLGEEVPTNFDLQSQLQNWMSVSLGANDDTNTNRDGNIITVDPDEEELCREEGLFDQSNAEELADCTAFFKDVTVNLVASAEDAGVLTYLYRQQPVISLGYSPTTDSFEFDLGGLSAVIEGLNEIDPDMADSSSTTMSGSFKFLTTQTNETEGQEAGSISMSIAKPIRLANTDEEGNSSLSMDPGTLFSISADAATGVGGMSFDLGAINFTGPSDSGQASMALAGFTGEADVNPTNGVLVVRNFGLSKGPFSLSVNNEEVIKATLGAFGFQVTEGTDLEPGEMILDGNMDLSIIAKKVAGLDLNLGEGVIATALDVMAPVGTSLARAGNGTTRVGGAGPFSVTVSRTPENDVPSVESVQVNSGECFNELFEESEQPSTALCM